MVERSETTGGIGKPVQRKEDKRLLTGQGVYVTDVWLPNTAYAWMVRSHHAHARIRGIDTSAALKSPGVIAVYRQGPARRWPPSHGSQAVARRPARCEGRY